ncbi:MAG: GlyGly-CTERM sorting domain-containing protein [Minwuia sp.]|nr:GlyGly-CTERM sorting domain-containing protein [Minwuia sp.]
MTVDSDAELLNWMRDALRTGGMRLHVNYRKARRNRDFHLALVNRVGANAVRIRDFFLYGSFALLLVWFGIAEALDLNAIMVPVAGSEMSAGSVSFFALLLVLVLAGRRYVRPLQGRILHEVALGNVEIFDNLWRSGTVALMAMAGRDRLCSSPKGDWRAFARRLQAGLDADGSPLN